MTVPVTNRERLGRNLDKTTYGKYMRSYTSPVAGSVKTSTGSIMNTNSFGQLYTEQRQLPRVDRGIAISAGNVLSKPGFEGFDTVWDFIRYIFGYRKYSYTGGLNPNVNPSAENPEWWTKHTWWAGLGSDDPYMVSRWSQRRIGKPTSNFYERQSNA